MSSPVFLPLLLIVLCRAVLSLTIRYVGAFMCTAVLLLLPAAARVCACSTPTTYACCLSALALSLPWTHCVGPLLAFSASRKQPFGRVACVPLWAHLHQPRLQLAAFRLWLFFKMPFACTTTAGQVTHSLIHTQRVCCVVLCGACCACTRSSTCVVVQRLIVPAQPCEHYSLLCSCLACDVF